jgi:hypothetical protein
MRAASQAETMQQEFSSRYEDRHDAPGRSITAAPPLSYAGLHPAFTWTILIGDAVKVVAIFLAWFFAV